VGRAGAARAGGGPAGPAGRWAAAGRRAWDASGRAMVALWEGCSPREARGAHTGDFIFGSVGEVKLEWPWVLRKPKYKGLHVRLSASGVTEDSASGLRLKVRNFRKGQSGLFMF
jgi:hypothetical protein